MRRISLAFFVILIVLSVNLVSAADIAYVVRNPSNPESNVIEVIEDLGYSYDLIDDNDILDINFSDYEMILVWDELLENAEYIPISERKSFVANTYYLDNWGIGKYAGSQISTGYIYVKMMKENRITRNIDSEVRVFTSTNVEIYYMPHKPKRASGIENIVAVEVGRYDMPVIGIINKGGELYGGGNADERIAFFGITKTEYWTQESEQLFRNTLGLIMTGDDSDSDGFYDDEDCDDSNSGVHPLAEEIPYNGIDEDCDGWDLEDVDEDGYRAAEVGGEDCDDSDFEINPGSEDVYKNCVNDAPIVEDIEKITVYETETVTIEVNAEDPESDSLYYSIDNSRFSQQNQQSNVFTWETNYSDEGTYIFTIIVSDGNLETEKEVEVEVKETNRDPICSEILELQWDEDTEASINLNDYCSDLDGDVLEFYVYDSSPNPYISLDSLEEGIAAFSSEKDWNGEDWIVFKADDGKDSSLTNEIILKVLPVNDEPSFIDNPGKINDITWNEDTNLIDYLDLDYYFSDVDGDKLEYDVVGNYFINIEINNGLVSFYPAEDWYGAENVVFSASDGQFIVYSNAVALTVLDSNEPPEFNDLECETEIQEDVGESCELEAVDVEDDDFVFSITNEHNLQCDVSGDMLNYVSFKDYNGPASCLIKVQDNYGYSEYLLEVNVLPVNDAPNINVEPDTNYVKILEGDIQLFKVLALDAEGDSIEINWQLDGGSVADESSYLFNQSLGNYDLEVIASDGAEETSHLWNILVGSVKDFTCQELDGQICKENEVCLGEVLGVKDTTSCCPTECSPKFGDSDRCEILSPEIEINIKDPNSNEKFDIGEIIEVEVKIKNKVEDDLNFDVEVYLYDLTEDESVEGDDDSVSVDEGDKEQLDFKFEIPDDIEEGNEHAIFVVADEGDYCNEDYVEIGINREKENIIIKDIRTGGEVVCGDFADVEVEVRNIGRKDQDVVIKVENTELGIEEKTESFELEKYDDKDEVKKRFKIKIPDNAAAGNYTLKITASFNGDSIQEKADLFLGKCKETEKQEEEIEIIPLGGNIAEAEKKVEEEQKGGNAGLLVLLIISMIVVIIAIIYLVYVILTSTWHNK